MLKNLPFFRTKQFSEAVALSSGLATSFTGLHPVQRSVIFILANLQLVSIARARSGLLVKAPAKCPPEVLDEAIKDALDVYHLIGEVRDDDPHRKRHAESVRHASALIAASLAVFSRPEDRKPVLRAWRSLWLDRGRAPHAVTWLRRRETESSVPVFPKKPNGDDFNDIEILRLANQLPPFLRPNPT
jgi:hypothetical protein